MGFNMIGGTIASHHISSPPRLLQTKDLKDKVNFLTLVRKKRNSRPFNTPRYDAVVMTSHNWANLCKDYPFMEARPFGPFDWDFIHLTELRNLGYKPVGMLLGLPVIIEGASVSSCV